MANPWVVVPVKRLGQAKQRLSSLLDDKERASLMLAMLDDVLRLLCGMADIGGILLVSNSRRARDLAQFHNVQTLSESQGGTHSTAVSEAATYLAERHGVTRMLALSADIPGITRSDIENLLAQTDPVVLVPDRHGTGTSAVLSDLPLDLQLQFGENSLRKHQASCTSGAAVFQNTRIAGDIDTIEDLFDVARQLHEGATRDYLDESGIAARLKRQTISILNGHANHLPSVDEARALAAETDLKSLCKRARELRDDGHRGILSYSRKVFIPLTRLCRNVCHYCTFATTPGHIEQPFLPISEIIEVARAGARAGCKEALFTLGDKPELRYRAAREALEAMGFGTTLEYLKHAAERVYAETGLLPHLNPGVMSADELRTLKPVAPSIGLMLESSSTRLCGKGQAHHGSPDKQPAERLAMIEHAGEQRIPTTSGILIGIGETRLERVESLLALRDLHERYGHLQEIIVQNFRAKPGTPMSTHPEPDEDELVWTIAIARLLFGPEMNIQAPPNLSPEGLSRIINAGINDLGGISPVTPDFVNPEAPWPEITQLESLATHHGMQLTERLCIYPKYVRNPETWADKRWLKPLAEASDERGFVRGDNWSAGAVGKPMTLPGHAALSHGKTVRRALDKAENGEQLSVDEIIELFRADAAGYHAVLAAADRCRQHTVGDPVSYVVNRNINYTNICALHCHFCAFSKGKTTDALRGAPYLLSIDEIQRRTREAWTRGATEICLQGGIHPAFTGETYLEILAAVKEAVPDIHVHGFTPQEILHGAETLGLKYEEYLRRLTDTGLGSLPGTAAEILNDEVRARLCPDKLSTGQWLKIMEVAHATGLKTTATIMFGHIDHARHWAEHLLKIRDLQTRSGGFTEFVPLPFVHQESPLFSRRFSRKGPTSREAILMHAVARLVLHHQIDNIQVSWVKMGREGVLTCLAGGCNDLGGTLMNESISRAAGAAHGEELSPASMRQIIESTGRKPWQRTTLYGPAPEDRQVAGHSVIPLAPVHNRPLRRLQCANLPVSDTGTA